MIPSFALLDYAVDQDVLKGDFVGHPFRGNQWSDASGASSALAGSSETQRDRDLDQSGREGAGKLNRQLVYDAAMLIQDGSDTDAIDAAVANKEEFLATQEVAGYVKAAVVKNLTAALITVSAQDVLDADWASLRATTTDANGNVDETPDYYSANPVYANIKSLVAQNGYCQLFRDGQGLVAVPADSTIRPRDEFDIKRPDFVGFYPKDPNGRSTSKPAEAIKEQIVNDIVKSWAETSNDSHPLSLAVQAVAATVFNVSGAMEWSTGIGGGPRPSSGLAKQPSWINDKQFHVIAEVLKAQHAATQAYFKKKGITHLQIFRGQQNQPTYFDEEERVKAESGQKAEILMRPLSSWAFDRSIAAYFSRVWARDFNTRDPMRLIAATVPVSQILSIPLTGAGCLNEKEAILIADSVMARAATGGKRDDVSWNPFTSTVKP